MSGIRPVVVGQDFNIVNLGKDKSISAGKDTPLKAANQQEVSHRFADNAGRK